MKKILLISFGIILISLLFASALGKHQNVYVYVANETHVQNETFPSCAFASDNLTLSSNIIWGECTQEVWASVKIGSQDGENFTATIDGGNKYYVIIPPNFSNSGTNLIFQFFAKDCFNFTYNGSENSFYIRNNTKLNVNPENPDGLNNWYVNEPIFSLEKDESGNDSYYQWDSTGPIPYSSPFGLEDIPNSPPKESAGTLELNWWTDFGECGNESKQTKVFYVDLINPQIDNIFPLGNLINNLNPVISAYLDEVYESNSGINRDSVVMKLDGVEVSAIVEKQGSIDAVVSYQTEELSQGIHGVEIYVEDNAGRINQTSWEFFVILTPIYDLQIFSPVEDIYDSKRIQFNISSEKELDLIEYIDWSSNNPRWKRLCSDCDEYGYDKARTKTFTDGEHSITIRTIDLFEQINEKNISFFIDSRAPRVSKTEPKRGFASGLFEIEFEEDNPKEMWLNYGNSFGEGYRNAEVDLSECVMDRRYTQCNITVNLSDYDGQEIEYWFNISDKAGNTDESRHEDLDVDVSFPKINNLTYEIDGKSVYFIINITEPYLDEVSYFYHDGQGRERRLCSRLKEGICEKKVSFGEGYHNITINVIDEVENKVSENVSLFIDSKPPRISKTEPKRNQVTNGSDFLIKYTEDNLKEVSISFNPETPLEQCDESGRNVECLFDLNLNAYDGEWVEYWFNVSDEVNTVGSRITRVFVDTTSPELNLIMPLGEVYGTRRINFMIDVSEEVKLEYRDEKDSNPRWRTLCTRCEEYGISRTKTKSFKKGEHELIIRASDKAGNTDEEIINFEVDY